MGSAHRVSVSRLLQCVSYCPATGSFSWVDLNCKRKAPLSTLGGDKGYLVGTIDGVQLVAHRCAVAINTGRWPNGQVDHINGNRSDNRICNLRVVTCLENHRNMGLPKNHRTGVFGVGWDNARKKWRAHIHVENKQVFLGRFDVLDQAISARKAAEKTYGFHENHGGRECHVP